MEEREPPEFHTLIISSKCKDISLINQSHSSLLAHQMLDKMAMRTFCKANDNFHLPIRMTQSSDDPKETLPQVGLPSERPPSEQFAPLASTFRRRLLTGVGTASLVTVGANFAGTTSFLLGLSPEVARSLKLDVIYPVRGYSRCIEADEGFEFIYPAQWVGDQSVFYRVARKAERSLDPPSLKNVEQSLGWKNVNEPVVAFGPPGSTGELNVSVIVSPVPVDFRIEAFGGPKEVGEALVKTVTSSGNVVGTLIETSSRQDVSREVKYYTLEFQVESSTFTRHNVAVCCAKKGRLFTLNAQAPESSWSQIKPQFYMIADSFNLNN